LFEDKREVELVWNGKTSEVIEQMDEPPRREAGPGVASRAF
jgi:hypothetical protein